MEEVVDGTAERATQWLSGKSLGGAVLPTPALPLRRADPPSPLVQRYSALSVCEPISSQTLSVAIPLRRNLI